MFVGVNWISFEYRASATKKERDERTGSRTVKRDTVSILLTDIDLLHCRRKKRMTCRTDTARNGPVVKSQGVGVNFLRYQFNRHKAPTDMRSAERRKILITNRSYLVTLYLLVDVFHSAPIAILFPVFKQTFLRWPVISVIDTDFILN